MRKVSILLSLIVCLVWFINGFFCKVLNLVPRHQLIVSRILGAEYARFITILIGLAEMMMVVWILSKIKPRLCATFQMVIVGVMNMLEFILAPDLLLFGKFNIVFAFCFILIIYVNEFVIPIQPGASRQ